MGKQSGLHQLKGTFLFTVILTLLSFLHVQADEGDSLNWISVSSPINSDLTYINFLSPDYGIAAGNQIIIYKNGHWIKYPGQPPTPVSLIFPVDTIQIFITRKTKYQESELYFGDGQHWEKRWTPLANTIMAINFTDRNNGIIAGIGEIAVLKNNQWHWLSLSDNKSVLSVDIDNDSSIWIQVLNSGLYKYNGQWLKIRNSDNVHFFRKKNDTVFVLGDNFYGYVNNHDSVIILSSCKDLKRALSFLPINKNEAIAVGTNGLIIHYKNGRWKHLASNVRDDLNAITMSYDSIYWITGDNGLLLRSSSGRIKSRKKAPWKGFKTIAFNSYAKVIDDEYGVVAADFDNDGLTDIFTCGLFEANHLYINRDGNNFTDLARKWNVSEDESNGSRKLNLGACAADFDNDGNEDIYVTVLNGKNKLYKNIRGKHFVDYSDISQGIGTENDRTNGVITGDVDNDGDLDIFITNEISSNRLFLNNGAGIFPDDITETAGLTTSFGGMGCSFGDIDNDGDLDLYVANWSAKNKLYRNLLKETGRLVFEDITEKAGVGGEAYTKSNAVVFADLDNDADLDLFVTNRKTSNKLYINNGQGIFEDKTVSLLGKDTLKSYGAVIADFDGDGYKDIYISNVGRNTFYKNLKGEKFVESTVKYGAGIEGYSTGSAAADFDNDGDIDLYIANYLGESSVLLRNNNTDRQFIQVSITGFENNRDGTGSKLYVYKDKGLDKTSRLISYREISGGSGYASMNQRFLPIPISEEEYVDVKVIFPDGTEISYQHIQTGSKLNVEDVAGTGKIIRQTLRVWKHQVKDPHKLIKSISWLLVVLILILSMRHGFKRYDWSWIHITVFSILLLLFFYAQSGYFEFKNILLSTILPLSGVLILISLIHLYFERTRIKRLSLAEQELIREKLSRDLHDDLASTISTIAIYLTLIRYNMKNTEKKLTELLDKTMALSGDASSAITDLIWAIKPQPESLDNLIVRINNNFTTLFKEKGIRFSTHSAMDTEHIILNAKAKKNVYLIVKEALNNILKYAEASSVSINITNQKPNIKLSVTDDGKGFDPETVKNKGHGLTNMNSRAEDMEAQFELRSAPGKGTEIILSFRPD